MRTAVSLTLAVLLLPALVHAAGLININTADATTLEGLPGVGPSIAASIIANRPYASIEDISRASGIGAPGSSSYEKIKNLITVGDAGASNSGADQTASSTPPDTPSDSTSTPVVASPASGGSAEYLPIPALRVVTGGDRTVSSGADTAFTAAVYDDKGNKRFDALVTWSFGDGMQRTGASVFHQYYGAGEYLAVVRATTPDGGEASDEIVVTVKDANIRITSVSPRGIALTNSDSRTLDLSLWRLSAGGQEFKIPADTHLLAGHTTLFPSQIIELPITETASLLFPSGEVAATYPAASPVAPSVAITSAGGGPAFGGQPSVASASFNQVQRVEPIINTVAGIPIHDEAVNAPTTTAEPAAVGAAPAGLLHSPWTLGLLGVIVAAGSVFIFL